MAAERQSQKPTTSTTFAEPAACFVPWPCAVKLLLLLLLPLLPACMCSASGSLPAHLLA